RLDKSGRFVGLLTANADGPACRLQSRDIRTFMRLRMRPQSDAARRIRHPVEIALEGVEIEDERRRLDGNDSVAGLCGQTLGHFRVRLDFRVRSANGRQLRRTPSLT